MAVSCEFCNELSDVLNGTQYAGKFNDCKLLKTNSASYGCMVGSLEWRRGFKVLPTSSRHCSRITVSKDLAVTRTEPAISRQ